MYVSKASSLSQKGLINKNLILLLSSFLHARSGPTNTETETWKNHYWLGHQTFMDESSDAEDPEATAKEELSAAKQELEDRSALIEALTERAERVRIVQDLERERMARADLEGRLSRA